MGRTTKKLHMSSRRKTSKHNRKSSEDEAGKAIAAGGFGCVFKPAIACNNTSINNKMKKTGYQYITKVMIARYAQEEMTEVNRVLPVVKKIPNYKRYFLLDGIYECKNFGPLNAEDLTNFNTKCNNLKKAGINATNVNQKLKYLSAIYIPYGGDSVAGTMKSLAKLYMSSPTSSNIKKKIGLITWGLSDVLENAVEPMNKLGLIHLDLKGDNMLININAVDDNRMPYVKVIDWGLAGLVPAQNIANAAKNRPLQFNAPFSNILFNEGLVSNLLWGDCFQNEISEVQINTIATQIVVKMVNDWPGHAAYISNDLHGLTAPYNKAKGVVNYLDSKAECTTEAITVIVEYIAAVLRKYMKRKENGLYQCSFDNKAYFHEVYRYNCDVWGLLTSFQDFVGQFSSYSKLRDLSLARAMTNILYKYCFSPTYAAERIPIKNVVDDMHKIAGMCGINSKPQVENMSVPMPQPPKIAPPLPPPVSPEAPKRAKKNKKKLVLKKASPDRGSTISLKGKKRCPKGYSKHPSKSGKCRKTVKKAKSTKKSTPKRSSSRLTLPLGRKRCPNGYKKISGDGIKEKIVCLKK